MNGAALLLLTAALGVDYGWEPEENGDLVYIIQINDLLLDELKNGTVIESEIHPDARGVRRFKIVAGDAQLPRQGASPAADPAPNQVRDENAGESRATQDVKGSTDPVSPPERPAARPSAPDLLNDNRAAEDPHGAAGAQDDEATAAADATAPGGRPSSAFEPRTGAIDDGPLPRARVSGFELSGRSAAGDDPAEEPAEDAPPDAGEDRFDPAAHGGGAFSPKPPWSLGDTSAVPNPATSPLSARNEDEGAARENSTDQDDPGGPVGASVPSTLRPEPSGKPIVHRQADYVEEQSPTNSANGENVAAAPHSGGNNQAASASDEASKPWMPLMATMLLLVMSAALNGYLAWIARDFYRRYRDLALDSRQAGAAT